MSDFPAQTIRVSVASPATEVYQFAVNPLNLEHWAAGLCRSVWRDGDEWKIATADGDGTIRFVEDNTQGILDHTVKWESGREVHVAMRVVDAGGGSEISMSVPRSEGTSDEDYALDLEKVERDLHMLKFLVEAPAV